MQLLSANCTPLSYLAFHKYPLSSSRDIKLHKYGRIWSKLLICPVGRLFFGKMIVTFAYLFCTIMLLQIPERSLE